MSEAIKTSIRAELVSQGFCDVGFAPPSLLTRDQARLRQFIENGEHGTMDWMAKNWHKRTNPKILLPHAKTVIMAAMNYAPQNNPLDYLQQKSAGNISVYARNRDYHDVIKKRLRIVASHMVQSYNCQVRLFVDTAPLAEKALAALASLGWQGKHTNLVSRQFGSWLFLGAILTDLTLPPDKPHAHHCGQCRKCLDICPTQAFSAPYKLDVRKCLSYLTIEHKSSIPVHYRSLLGNRIYGCDDCLAVCPWNKFAKTANDNAYHARNELNNPPLKNFLKLNEASFRNLFTKSPIKRIGFERFIRNVLIAAGNSHDRELLSGIQAWCEHPSPIIAECAQWAKTQIITSLQIKPQSQNSDQ